MLFPLFAQGAGTALPSIVGFKGDAKVLFKTGQNLPSLLFEGERFYYSPAKLGMKVEVGSIIICSSDCRIKLVYPSGTSIFIAPGTTFQVMTAESEGSKESSTLKLLYGRIRALISKTQTKKFEVRTPSVVTGVRGTDFLTRHIPSQGSEIAVLSGQVQVAPVEASKPKLDLKPRESVVEDAKGDFKVEAVTKAQVISAYEATVVPVPKNEPAIQALEEKSKINLIEELKASQPVVYEALADAKALSTDQLNRKLIEEPLKKARSRKQMGHQPEAFDQDLEKYKKLEEGR